MNRRKTLGALGAGALAWASPWVANAQSATRLLVGATPGGGTDIVARALAQELSSRLGRQFVVDNRPGAAGNIAAQAVAKSAPDGATLLLSYTSHVINPSLYAGRMPFDAQADFSPLAGIATLPAILVAKPGLPANNISELIALAKSRPGKLNLAIAGLGSSNHLAGEMLKSQGNLFMTHIPYRGVAPLTNDLVGNNLEFGVFVLSSGLPHIKSGKVMALGTTEAKRSPITPDIPALAESPQFKNVDIGVWFALMAPANLPKPVHDKLRKALTDALQSPEFRKKLEATGSVVASPTVDTDKYIASEIDKYRKIVQFAKIEE